VTNLVEPPHILALFKDSFGKQRYHCFDTTFNKDPHYIVPG